MHLFIHANSLALIRLRDPGLQLQHSHEPSAEGFYPQNLACIPKNDEVPCMLLYTEGTEIRNKTKCTTNFKV